MYARQETPRLEFLVSHGHKVRSHSFLNAKACPKTTLRIPFQGSQYGPGKSRDPDPSVGREAWAHNRWLAGSHRQCTKQCTKQHMCEFQAQRSESVLSQAHTAQRSWKMESYQTPHRRDVRGHKESGEWRSGSAKTHLQAPMCVLKPQSSLTETGRHTDSTKRSSL